MRASMRFVIAAGLLVGGCWSVAVRAVRDAREREWEPPQP
jgi:hypothetical protein